MSFVFLHGVGMSWKQRPHPFKLPECNSPSPRDEVLTVPFNKVCPCSLGKPPQWVFGEEARTSSSLWKMCMLGIYLKFGTLKLNSLEGDSNRVGVF